MALLFLPGDLARYLESEDNEALSDLGSLRFDRFAKVSPYGYYRYLRAGIARHPGYAMNYTQYNYAVSTLAHLPEFKVDLASDFFARLYPDSIMDLREACLRAYEPRLFRFAARGLGKWRCDGAFDYVVRDFKIGSFECFYDLDQIPSYMVGFISYRSYEKWREVTGNKVPLSAALLADNWKLAEVIYQQGGTLNPRDLKRLGQSYLFTDWEWLIKRFLVTQEQADSYTRVRKREDIQ